MLICLYNFIFKVCFNLKMSKKIAFFTDVINVRGTCVALYDYAHYNEKILNNESVIFTTHEAMKTSCPYALLKFAQRFTVIVCYLKELDKTLLENNCDYFYCIKHGKKDNICTNVIPCLVHCVFDMSEPHGTVFTAVSSTLAKKFRKKSFVPHMISLRPSKTKEHLRKVLNIPETATVFGRYGGMDTFNLEFCWEVIRELVLDQNKNIYFLFINTPQVVKHPKILYLNKVTSEEDKNRFICTCDAHLECGTLGHTFGLAIGEFSVNNKPIIAFKDPELWNTAHLDILGEKGLYFTDKKEFKNLLINFDRKKYENLDMNCYKEFSPENVMKKFSEVFLEEFAQDKHE